MIRGGYILQPRKFCDSSVAKMPPATREVWFYLLRKVNYLDNPRSGLKRGTGFFTYQQIMDDLCWYAGYRKITYTKNDIAKSLRRLRESSTIDTVKETRGVIVTVCNYEFYQEPKNYEGHTESITKAPRKVRGVSTIQEEGYKNKKKEKVKANPTLSEVKTYFSENGYSETAGENAWHYYKENDWEDSNGKPVLNWKSKMRAVWFKDDNKKTGTYSNFNDDGSSRQVAF